jgi:putative transposase
MLEPNHQCLSIRRQCELLKLHRSGLYYVPVSETSENLEIMRILDAQYFLTPFYGERRLMALLRLKGYNINRKRIRRLMKLVNWNTLFQEPNTSKPDKSHKIYPYLLKGMDINKANYVWSCDITYIPMKKGFMYLCAIIDVHTRYVVNWGISNTMNAEWCRGIADVAILKHGKPEIFNTDQGSQFTSEVFTGLLKEHEIKISMDGKGRALDNVWIERLWRSVKYEHIYLNVHEDGLSLYQGLKGYFNFYNRTRVHQSLDYSTPIEAYTAKAA